MHTSQYKRALSWRSRVTLFILARQKQVFMPTASKPFKATGVIDDIQAGSGKLFIHIAGSAGFFYLDPSDSNYQSYLSLIMTAMNNRMPISLSSSDGLNSQKHAPLSWATLRY